jgi:hypothetical protein|tara:strand:+ start:515 stop:721 length:207 start_codon:yes stop_codon:yes gene_type:complete
MNNSEYLGRRPLALLHYLYGKEINADLVKSLSDLEPVSFKAVDISKTEDLSIDLKSFLIDAETTELLH